MAAFAQVGVAFHESHEMEGRPLRSGSTAAVHRAAPRDGGASVAAKVFGAAGGDAAPAELCREVAMLSAVQGHPNVVRFHGLFALGGSAREELESENEPKWCLTMELCAMDLYDSVVLRRYPERLAKQVARHVLGALGHVHGRGVLHRDVKVENILLRHDGSAALADFGLACSTTDSDELMKSCGSPGYVAPEVIRQEPFRLQSDVWGVGVVLYFILSGRLPFKGATVISTLKRSARAALAFEQHAAFETISDQCKDCIKLLLAKSYTDRPLADAALEKEWLS